MAFDLTVVTSVTYNASGLYGYSMNGGRAKVTGTSPLPSASIFTVDIAVKGSGSATQVAVGQADAFWIGSNGTNAYAVYGNATDITTSVNIRDGSWHSLRLTIDGSNGGKLYVDGTQAGSNATSAAAAGIDLDNNEFGVRDFAGTGFMWSGEIDDIAIYSSALIGSYTPAVISDSASGLIAVWHLDNNLLDSKAAGGGGLSIPVVMNQFRQRWTA